MKITKEQLLNGAGVIGVGILSSAGWDALKPILALGWDFLLNITTLGIGSLKDAIYADARFSMETEISRVIVSLAAAAPFIAILGTLAVQLRFLPRHPGTASAIKIRNRMADGIFVFIMFVLLQMFQHLYVIELVKYRDQIDALAAVESSERDLRIRAAQLTQIETKAQFLAYIESGKAKIAARGITPPPRDFF